MAPYERIKHAILSGELLPDRPLVEQSLAQWCGVSRTPIREALRRLEQDGLIHRDAHGLVVRSRSPEEILDIYETRIVLEAEAGRFAADRRNDHDLRRLQWSLARYQEVDPADPVKTVEANQLFHQAVWRSTHNECLIDLLQRLRLHRGRYSENTLAFPGRWETSLVEHEELVTAIAARDPDRARDVAARHFAASREIRLLLFAQGDTHN